MKTTKQKSLKLFILCFFFLSLSINAQHFTFDTSVGDVKDQATSVTMTYKKAATEGHTGILEMTTVVGKAASRITLSHAGMSINSVNSWVKIVYKAQTGFEPKKFRVNNGNGNITSPEVIIANDTWQTYWFDLSGEGNWTGVSNVFFFLTGGDTSTGTFKMEIDEISFVTRTTADGAIPTTANASINIEHAVTSALDITIAANTTYRIEPNKSLDITGNLTTNNGLSIASGGSLKVSGTSTGNITYKRNLGTTNWYLVSSPVVGQSIVDFYTNSTLALGTGAGNAQNVAIAPYKNNEADVNDRWAYYVEGLLDGEDGDDVTDTFASGSGYTVKLQSSQDIYFTGTMQTSNVPVTLQMGGTSGTNFNALGNPFPSFINGATFLSAETLDLDSETAWVFNQLTGNYDTKTSMGNPGFKIAPGQGFFVEASATNDVLFTTSIQSVESTDTFQKTASRTEIFLNLESNNISKKARILYDSNATLGFDNGYDGKMFEGVSSDLEIYTHLLQNNNGVKYDLQIVPNSNLETTVIPVGLKVQAGLINFSAESLNLPIDIKVFLEDRVKKVFTRLDKANSNYEVTLSEALNGVGRFYLHTSAKSSLSVDIIELQGVSIFKSNASTLKIEGLQQGKASVSLFNIQGKQILSSSFEANGVKEISLPKLTAGVYFVQLTTEDGKLNKKIILE